MICPYCGRENPDELEVCGFCGGPLLPSGEPAAPEVQPAPPPVEILQTKAETEEPGFGQVEPAKPPSGGLYKSRIWWIAGCAVFICLVLACIAAVIGIYRTTKWLSFLNPAAETLVSQAPGDGLVTPEAVLPLDETNPATLAPTLAAQSTPKVLYFDDFSDQNSGWYQEDATDYSLSYFNSAFRIKINADMLISWATLADRTFSNAILEVDATKNGGPDDNDFGLICRYLDGDRFYYGAISSDGYYGIFKVSTESTDLIGRENMEYSDLIERGSTLNTIRFGCIGNVLTLSVNGQVLDLQSDSDYATGNVGLMAGTYDTPGTDILFDNFTVYSP